MNVGDLQIFLRELGKLLAANKGNSPAGEFESFCAGLEPFKEHSVGVFAQFLGDAAEYQRTGVVPIPSGRKKPERKQATTGRQSPKPPLKKKEDVRAVEEAAARLQELYDRATDPALTHEAIKAEVDRVDREFDAGGLKAVAQQFGIKGGFSGGKAAVKAKIWDRIAERKGRFERGQVISEVAKGTGSSQAELVEAVDTEVVEEVAPTTQ